MQIVESEEASVGDKRRAVVNSSEGTQDEWEFWKQVAMAVQRSLHDDNVQAARDRLRERAAIFGLEENPTIDTECNCQLDAALARHSSCTHLRSQGIPDLFERAHSSRTTKPLRAQYKEKSSVKQGTRCLLCAHATTSRSSGPSRA
jgi:hypothetical protein